VNPWQHQIIPRAKALYTPIPKCACTTLKKASLEFAGVDRLFKIDGDWDPAFNVHWHSPLQVEGPLNEWRDRGLWSFSCVRNPWDRLVSCWIDKIARPTDDPLADQEFESLFSPYPWFDQVRRHMPFEEFARVVCSIEDDDLCEPHFRPMAWFIADESGAVPDFVARVESLDHGLAHVCEILQLEADLVHAHPDPDGRKTYQAYYTPQLADQVGRRYRRDVELFGYSFEVAG